MPAAPAQDQNLGPPPAQLRRGQHRNSALAAWRRSRAIQLATRGLSYQQIADELGYANRGTVHRIVQQALADQQVKDVDFHRLVEVGRLDALQVSLWDAAIAGDIPAVLACLRIINMRSRLLGLYPDRRTKDPKDRWDNCQGPRTVVVRPDDCRHAGCDRHGRFERLD
jgi:transposase-like protein